MMNDIKASASALYDGGWRHTDREELIAEYAFVSREADLICRELKQMEKEGSV
jgi:hypothetical protein